MTAASPDYEPHYLAGIVLFNQGDFFEAHEVWEHIWLNNAGPDKPFYQGLIQAAVGLCHFCNGNARGALKLYHSSRKYLERFAPLHHGLNLTGFFADMERCFTPLLEAPDPAVAKVEIEEDKIPVLHLDPPPPTWPDPAQFLEEDGQKDKD